MLARETLCDMLQRISHFGSVPQWLLPPPLVEVAAVAVAVLAAAAVVVVAAAALVEVAAAAAVAVLAAAAVVVGIPRVVRNPLLSGSK